MVLWELLSHRPPVILGYRGPEILKFLEKVFHTVLPSDIIYFTQGNRLPKPTDCPDSLYDVMKDCWMQDPASRPTFKQIVEALDAVILTCLPAFPVPSPASPATPTVFLFT